MCKPASTTRTIILVSHLKSGSPLTLKY